MRETLLRLAIGLYLLWLAAVVLLLLGRHTPVLRFEPIYWAVVAGAGVLTVLGAGKLLRDGYARVGR